MTNLQVIVGVWFVVAMVIIVAICLVLRDIATHAYYQKKSDDGYIVAEFVAKVGSVFVEVVKIDNRDNGAFTYKDRQYFTGKEKFTVAYPPGRSRMAQVNMPKCYPNPASSDMATNIYGKPTVDAILVGALVQQRDTHEAMERSRDESGGGNNTAKKNQMWTWIALGLLGAIGTATLVFIIKGQGVNEAILAAIQELSKAFGGQ